MMAAMEEAMEETLEVMEVILGVTEETLEVVTSECLTVGRIRPLFSAV